MTVWIVLGCVFVCILLLLSLPITLRTTASEQSVRAEISYLGVIRKSVYPLPPKRKRRKKRQKSKAEPKAPIAQKKGNLKSRLSQLRELRGLIAAILIRMPRTFSLAVERLQIRVASDDPAKTALLYGAISSTLSFSLAWLDRHLFSIKPTCTRNISLVADFEGERITLDADLRLRTTPYRLLALGVKVLLPYFFSRKNNKKKRIQHTKKGAIPCQK